jgi:putative hydrolase of the HAD superfamily
VTKTRLLILDGDDTLWFVEALYDEALDRAQQVVEEAGLDGSRWRSLQRSADLENVRTMGMSPERFPRSSREALRQVADGLERSVVDALEAEVDLISRSVFSAKAPPAPGVVETLRLLGETFHLALLTKGDEAVQRHRIADAGVAPYLDAVHVVAEKSTASFLAIVDEFGVLPADAWSVGNSLPSDINPAVRGGLNAVWIDAHVWEHERREIDLASANVVVLEKFVDLPGTLSAFVTAE